MLRTRTLMAGMLSIPVNAVLFGTGAVVVLSIPQFQPYLEYILPAVIGMAFALTWPVAWKLAPRLRVRNDFYPNLFRKT
ncbi:hypothetical protein T8K17_00105 [Thalassobaculum sp. OXR-137]|uniref:hypothetical protein n=1 Tax=Thalassobaculum sp. OXR-137 TaxID=3100173 RepID=UPI002AC8A093|nr:hypothetical protein [Thalassobaculum sp. OXR-137]WPZ34549.1 hypothetical protein T8K17_00105 [Thalassobaculum sp. OXR-137]